MFRIRLYYCAALLIQLALVTHQLVPYSGATRFVPNWWTAARRHHHQPSTKTLKPLIFCRAVHQSAGVCRNSEDCSQDECCVRSTGSRQHRFCLPLRQSGEACRLTQQNLAAPGNPSHLVYLNLCPCANGLVCREIHSGWIVDDAECVSPAVRVNPAELLRHSFLQAILNVLKQRQHQLPKRRTKIPVSSFPN